ncbi:MAG: hypothetical protein WCT10_02685 [Patescibacteria group bacterium]
MEASMTNITRLPRAAAGHIQRFIGRYPVYAPVAALLPAETSTFRPCCERILSELFRRTLHAPKLASAQAAAAIVHDTPRREFADEELRLMENDPETAGLHAIWAEVWQDESDPELREMARYFAALFARLYRLEHLIRHRDQTV